MVKGRLSLLEASELDLGPYAERYRRWCTLYRYLFGELPRVVPVGGVDPKDGAPLRAFVCEHALFRDHIALGATRTWEHSAKLMGHLHGLGYQAWSCRCFNQIPTVETYMTLHRRFVGADYGFDLEFSELARHRLTFFEWLRRCFECVFVVHLTTADFYDGLDLLDPPGPRFETDVRLVPHVIEVVHDLSQHIPNYHYYPKELLRRFAERIRDAMSDPVFEDALRNKPGPVAGFYDNDINAYAYQVWARIDDPGDFPNLACEPRNLRQIFAVLDKRIAETAEIGRSRGAQRGRFQLVDAKQRARVAEPPPRVVPPPVARGEDASRAAAPFLQEPVRHEPDASWREPGAVTRPSTASTTPGSTSWLSSSTRCERARVTLRSRRRSNASRPTPRCTSATKRTSCARAASKSSPNTKSSTDDSNDASQTCALASARGISRSKWSTRSSAGS
jgi:hypothetical protein